MKLAWTPEARADRRAIYTYIEAENATAALALDELLAKRSKQLITHPMTGRPGRVSGTRELVVHRNYLLVYDLADEMVRIIRILHAAQQWPPSDFQPIP
ncbi:type II toxin-antitoxin system RelE/ParE family toxin [Rhizobium sp. AB2/73]|uniref:type II toxin-antitoxin system RelE/ParE family toxin n=1 Tax=Rhizobium sp. AB2/73 TaxID=2795216 RepID=UPI000DDF49F6|nr:type II toxin-antitoxin system RelE/ParE family toxin [Rhizobium sp. AB2/73]QYA13391.1 type II toxin-antitoxin system RelE/ParE family toxin [Rhizobium sp. AB2/73]UEQ80676.1 type II toxin-antitoxin system RelE/ParE family toxin [Rhizobium sp. AB2/73]